VSFVRVLLVALLQQPEVHGTLQPASTRRLAAPDRCLMLQLGNSSDVCRVAQQVMALASIAACMTYAMESTYVRGVCCWPQQPHAVVH
jgi:hypothetical protein